MPDHPIPPYAPEVESWRRKLTDPRARIRRRSVRELARIGAWSAVRLAADDPDTEVRRLVARSLGRGGGEGTMRWRSAVAAERQALRQFAWSGEDALATLARLAGDGVLTVQVEALQALGSFDALSHPEQADEAAAVLRTALAAPHGEVTAAAREALLRLGSQAKRARKQNPVGIQAGAPSRKRRPSGKRAPPRKSRRRSADLPWEWLEVYAHGSDHPGGPPDTKEELKLLYGDDAGPPPPPPTSWVDAASPVGQAVARLREEGQEPRVDARLRDRVAPEAREALYLRVGRAPPGARSIPELPSLDRLRGWPWDEASKPKAETLVELACAAELGLALEVDWEALLRAAARQLAGPCAVAGYELELVVAGFVRMTGTAPPWVLEGLAAIAAGLHDDWIELWALVGTPPRLPGLPAEVRHGLPFLASVGRRSHAGRAPLGHRLPVREASLEEVLAAGAGLLDALDYPAFDLVSRQGGQNLSLEVEQALASVVEQLWVIDAMINAGVPAALHACAKELLEALPPSLYFALLDALTRDAAAYVVLRTSGAMPAGVRIRREHLRRFWIRADAPTEPPFAILGRAGHDLAREGLVLAAVVALHDRLTEDDALHARVKVICTQLARLVAATVGMAWADERPPARPLDLLFRQFEVVPIEVAGALGLDQRQGLPRLAGGRLTELERQWVRLAKTAGLPPQGDRRLAPVHRFHCRPISKARALGRGRLGGDCSTSYVPLRALSPHHVYYGIFQGGVQQRGYMTVFEAWSRGLGEDEGEARPVLCLETINVPIKEFDQVQHDLVEIFDAIAESRGLTGLVVIDGCGTWNYANRYVVDRNRRVSDGPRVFVLPADPAWWRHHAGYDTAPKLYSAFQDEWAIQCQLAPRAAPPAAGRLSPDDELLQPENVAEAARLRALPRRPLLATLLAGGQVKGFISALPRPPQVEVALARCAFHRFLDDRAAGDEVAAAFAAWLGQRGDPVEVGETERRLEMLRAAPNELRAQAAGQLVEAWRRRPQA